MEIKSVDCECCSLREECTQEYISSVKANLGGKWLCGLCAEAARDETRGGRKSKACSVEEAVMAHMSFCRRFRSNPAAQVANGMRQMLRRRSGDLATVSGSVNTSSNKYGRSVSSPQVG